MKQVKYKLIAVDMDGTLLNDESMITERTKSAVISAIEMGILFVVSTGRSMTALKNIKNSDVLIENDMPLILFNGANVITGKSQKRLFSSSLQADYVKQIYNFGVDRNTPVIIWIGEQLWVSHDCEAVQDYQRMSGAEINIINDIDIDEFKSAEASKMLWIDEPDNIRRYQQEMSEYFNRSINCHISKPELLEFVSAEASKGNAMREIGKIYGIDRSEMIAVGDSYNDVSMLEYAGFSVAMQNAPDDIKAICKYVTLSNNDDGVAAAIDKFILM